MLSMLDVLSNPFPPPPIGVGRVHRLTDDDLPPEADRLREIEDAIARGADSLGAIREAITFHAKNVELTQDINKLAEAGTVLVVRNGRRSWRYLMAYRGVPA